MMEDKDKNEAAVPFLHCVLEACDGLPEFEYDKASTEPLAPLDYAVEQKVKNLALKLFWKRNGIAGTPGEIVAAELPRRYRTTSKRRVDFFKGKARSCRTASCIQPPSPDASPQGSSSNAIHPDK